MTNKIVFILTITLLLSFNGFTQNSIKNILDLKYLKKSGQITQDDKIVGYYMFYFKEKEDKINSTYEVQFFDNNYNHVNSFEITRPKNSLLYEIHYNGKAFLLFYYDNESGFEYTTYDIIGNVLGTVKQTKKEYSKQSKLEIATIWTKQSMVESMNFFNTTGNTGFIRSSLVQNNQLGYILTKYNNEMEELWNLKSSLNSELLEQLNIIQVNESIITAIKNSKKTLMTKKFRTSFLIIDSETGKIISEIQMEDEILGKQLILKSYTNLSNSNISLIGQYFSPGDDVLNDKSQGLFLREINKSGEILITKKYSWKGDIAKFKSNNLSDDQKKEAVMPFSIFFHDVVRSKNGHTFFIGEEYRKQVSSGAIALNILESQFGIMPSKSNFEIRINNMIIAELDEQFNLINYKTIEKKSNSVFLPQGVGLYSLTFLGYFVKNMGAFDYVFTSKDRIIDKFSVLYLDKNKKNEKGSKKSDAMLGIVDINKGELTNERVPFNSDFKTFWISSAKPGNISITEYDSKEKTLHMRLEKISY